MCSDTWATVSCSYRADLLHSSPQKALLAAAPEPFAHPNGIPVVGRKARLMRLPTRKMRTLLFIVGLIIAVSLILTLLCELDLHDSQCLTAFN
jgi:hypothetical protein